jgi:hypothetical protein
MASRYTLSVQIVDDKGQCDFNFSHVCSGPELALYAKQFARIVANGPAAAAAAHFPDDADDSSGVSAQSRAPSKKVGSRVKADGFDRPSVAFSRATRNAPKLPTDINPQAPRTADATSHQAIFGEDEADFEAAFADAQLGGFKPTAYDYATLHQ